MRNNRRDDLGWIHLIVGVRIALSLSPDIEVDGVLSWRRAVTEAKLQSPGFESEG